MTKFNERYPVSSDTINTHTESRYCTHSWWADYSAPGIPQASFYAAAKREDEQRFSLQPREVPVFTDQRFGAIKPSRTNVEAD